MANSDNEVSIDIVLKENIREVLESVNAAFNKFRDVLVTVEGSSKNVSDVVGFLADTFTKIKSATESAVAPLKEFVIQVKEAVNVSNGSAGSVAALTKSEKDLADAAKKTADALKNSSVAIEGNAAVAEVATAALVGETQAITASGAATTAAAIAKDGLASSSLTAAVSADVVTASLVAETAAASDLAATTAVTTASLESTAAATVTVGASAATSVEPIVAEAAALTDAAAAATATVAPTEGAAAAIGGVGVASASSVASIEAAAVAMDLEAAAALAALVPLTADATATAAVASASVAAVPAIGAVGAAAAAAGAAFSASVVGIAAFRAGLNEGISSILNFKTLLVGALATIGLFKVKNFFEGIIGDAAKVEQDVRRVSAAVGELNMASVSRIKESLKQTSINEGVSVSSLVPAAQGVIPDIGEKNIGAFIAAAQRFALVAGGSVTQTAENLVFIMKGFNTEAEIASDSVAKLAESITDKLYVASKEGNISMGQLTSVIGFASQQADVLGISFDELLTSITALGDVGIKPMKGFRLISQILANVQNPSSDALAAVERLNQALPSLDLDFSNAGLKADGLNLFLTKLSRALKANESEAKLLGFSTRELGGLFKITADDGEKLNGILAKIQSSKGEVQRADDFIFAGAEGSLEKISSLVSVLKDDLAEIFLPALEKILGNYLKGLTSFRDAFGATVAQTQQISALVTEDKNLKDPEKIQILGNIESAQTKVRESAFQVALEFFLIAVKTGGAIIGDFLLAAFAKGGQMLSVAIMEAMGKSTPTVQFARYTAVEGVVNRINNNNPNATIGGLPSSQDAQGALVALNQFMRETFAEIKNTPDAIQKMSESQQKFYELTKSYGETKSPIQANSPELNQAFRLFLDQYRTQELVKQNDIDLAGNPTGASYLTSKNNQSANAGIEQLMQSLESSNSTTQLNNLTPDRVQDIADVIVYSLKQQSEGNPVTNPQSAAINTAIDKLGVRGKTVAEFNTVGNNYEVQAAEEGSASYSLVNQAVERAKENLLQLSKAFRELNAAGDSQEKIKEVAASASSALTPLIGLYAQLKQQQKDATKVVNDTAEKLGYNIEVGSDGVQRITEKALEANKKLASSSIAEVLAAKDKASAVALQQWDIIDKKTVDSIKLLGKLEIERLKARGDLTGADKIQKGLDELVPLEASIAQTRDAPLKGALKGNKTDINLAEIGAKLKANLVQVATDVGLIIDKQYIEQLNTIKEKQNKVFEEIGKLTPETAEIVMPKWDPDDMDVTYGQDLANQLTQIRAEQDKLLLSQIEKAATSSSAEQTEASRKLLLTLSKEAEKTVLEIVGIGVKIQSDALKLINKPQEAAVLETQYSRVGTLVSDRDKATSSGDLKAAEDFNTQIRVAIAELKDVLAPEIKDIYSSIIVDLSKIENASALDLQKIVGELIQKLRGAKLSLVKAQNDLNQTQYLSNLKKATEEVYKAKEQKTYAQEGSISGLKSQAYSMGGYNFEAAKIEAANSALQETNRLILEINSSYDITDENIKKQLEMLIELRAVQESTLTATLQDSGVSSSIYNTENGNLATQIELRKKLYDLQAAQPQVNETLRLTSKALDDLNRKYQLSIDAAQKYSEGTSGAFIEIPAVIGRGIYPMNKLESATKNSAAATIKYRDELQALLDKLNALKDANPGFAPNIQNDIDRVTNAMDGLADKIAEDGQSAGSRFATGLQQGLGQAQDFATTLGQGIGGAIQNNIGIAVDNVINGVQSMGEAFQQFVSQTLIDIGSLIIKMLLLRAIQSAVGGIMGIPLNSGGSVPEGGAGYNKGGIVNSLLRGFNSGGFVDAYQGYARLAYGGTPPRRNGLIPGLNIDKDTVPSLLTAGEFVIKKSAVLEYGEGFLQSLNQKLIPKESLASSFQIQKYADGGSVQTVEQIVQKNSSANTPKDASSQPSKPSSPTVAYVLADETAMQNLLRGGKGAMMEFLRHNKRNI